MSTLWRLCHNPLLPMDFRPVAADLQQTLDQLAEATGEHLDLSRASARAAELARAVATLAQQCAASASTQATPAQISADIVALNRKLISLSRILIPITYTVAGNFDHDPAWGQPHLPTLAETAQLAEFEPESNDYQFLRTCLIRNRNQVDFALRRALEVVSGTSD